MNDGFQSWEDGPLSLSAVTALAGTIGICKNGANVSFQEHRRELGRLRARMAEQSKEITERKNLGRYQILDVIGKGSMGVVYKAVDPEIGKLVAIKTMSQKLLNQPEMQERFYREGSILGQLQHKNIIGVYNVGVDGDDCYIAMEYLDGISLEHIMSQGEPLEAVRAVRIAQQICDAVQAAHKQSIVHRDIKPANVFVLEDDHVKVLDFGVAHFQDSQLTSSGVLLGTINYMAPEQITGEKIDFRSDIFSIGVILYELLSGRNPFMGKTISQTMVRLVNEDPPAIPKISRRLQEILDKALAKEREKRYGSCRFMASDLEAAIRADDLTNKAAQESTLRTPQSEILEKMIGLRADTALKHLKAERLEQAREIIDRLRELNPDVAVLESLEDEYRKSVRRRAQKRLFMEQLIHDTLIKANEHMSERHYVQAVELCWKVLKTNPENQDAKVIKAACYKKLQKFMERFEAMEQSGGVAAEQGSDPGQPE